MNQKKVLPAVLVLGAIGIFALLLWAYQQMGLGTDMIKPEGTLEEVVNTEAIPDTLEGVSQEITNQVALDDAALEVEINAETTEIEKESGLLSTLNQSYDEN